MKRNLNDVIVIGFALFAMFFGAGNVIFPPYLGLQAGKLWTLGFIFYFIADVGLAILAILAMIRHGSAEAVLESAGKIPGIILMTISVLCVGPIPAIPRTAATTYEMSILPLFPNIPPFIFSIIFFAIIILLCLQESAVIDIIGKFLTPGLLIGLLVLIIEGIVNPIGSISDKAFVDNVPIEGIRAGYQTMDVIAALVFGAIILSSAKEKGYTDAKKKSQIIAQSSIIAGIGLLIVYGGLTFLGANTGGLYNLDIDRATLVVNIVQNLLGKSGIIIFAIVVGLACLTTAIGLVSSAADYFHKLSNKKISYRMLVILICICSAIFANFGLSFIISIAAPLLDIIYPPILVLVLIAFVPENINKSCYISQFATLGAFIYNFLSTLDNYIGLKFDILSKFPFASIDLGWILPAIFGGIIGLIIKKDIKAN